MPPRRGLSLLPTAARRAAGVAGVIPAGQPQPGLSRDVNFTPYIMVNKKEPQSKRSLFGNAAESGVGAALHRRTSVESGRAGQLWRLDHAVPQLGGNKLKASIESLLNDIGIQWRPRAQAYISHASSEADALRRVDRVVRAAKRRMLLVSPPRNACASHECIGQQRSDVRGARG